MKNKTSRMLLAMLFTFVFLTGSIMTAVSAEFGVEVLSAMGDMESADALTPFTLRLSGDAFGAVSTLSLDKTGGVDGSQAALITKASDITGYGGSLLSDRFTLKNGYRVSFKAGYTYYFSAMTKSDNKNTRFWQAVEADGGQNFSWKVRYGNAAVPDKESAELAFNSQHNVGGMTNQWNRLTWTMAVDEIKDADGIPAAETGDVFNTYLILSGPGGFTSQLKPDAGEAYPIRSWIDDRYILEVPSSDLTKAVLPKVNGAKIEQYDTKTLRVLATSYDVNPNVTPAVSYQWQVQDGSGFKDIPGANSDTYILTETDGGKTVRAAVTAKSTASSGDTKTATAVSNGFEIPQGGLDYEPDTKSVLYQLTQTGDMETDGALLPYTTRLSLDTFGSVSNVSADLTGGVDGSRAALVTKTDNIDTNKYPGSLLSDRFTLQNDYRISFKQGYTYYFSSMTRSDSENARFRAAVEREGAQNFTWKVRYGSGSNPDGEGSGYSFNSAHTTGGIKNQWERHAWTMAVDEISNANGVPMAETGNVFNTYLVISGPTGLSSQLLPSAGEQYPIKSWIDDRFILEVPSSDLTADVLPRVYDVEVMGEFVTGNTLSARATAYDVNPGVTPVVSYRWQRLNQSAWEDIPGAAGESYTVGNVDTGYSLRAVATAVSTTSGGVQKSASAVSPAVTSTATGGYPPVASDVRIEGRGALGETIRGLYTFFDRDGDPDTGTTFRWYRADTEDGVFADTGVTTQEYRLGDADIDKYLKFEVIPRTNTEPTEGLPASVVIAGPAAPEAREVHIAGTVETDSVVEGSFTYFDRNGSEEGQHTYAWYVSDTPDGGQTKLDGSQKHFFIPRELDGKYLIFSVIPASADEPDEGREIKSEPVLIGSKTGSALFIAPDGSDEEGDGSIHAPFATIEKARNTIRLLPELPKGGITVYLRGGTYPVSNTITFNSLDSGTADAPIIYRPYRDEKVSLTGAKQIDFRKFTPIAGEMRDKLIDEIAKSKVKVADLDEIGLSDYAGLGITTVLLSHGAIDAPILEFDGELMTLSRYPNSIYRSDWCDITSIDKDETSYTVSYEGIDRVDRWTHNNCDKLMMMGYFSADWYAETNFFTINRENKTLTSNTGKYLYGVGNAGEKRDAYFANIYEEIDMPGEWYIDETNRKMYVYPMNDNVDAEITMSYADFKFFNISGANYLTFYGFDILGGKASVLSVNDSNNVVFDNCKMHSFQGNIGNIGNTSTNCGIRNSEIYNLSKGGITVAGGDTDTLTPGNNFITNNYIHDFSVYCDAYGAAVSLAVGSVGNLIDHNEFANSPHEVIAYRGYNHIMEYNTFHDVCTNAADMGAIYTGRRLDQMGNIMRYNHFYSIGRKNKNANFRSHAIFVDDGSSGDIIYGNVFGPNDDNCEVLKVHGGVRHEIYNNLFIDSAYRLFADAAWTQPQWINVCKNITDQKADGYTDPSYRAVNFPQLYETLSSVLDKPMITEKFPWLLMTQTDECDLWPNVFTKNASIYVNYPIPNKKTWYDRRFPEYGEAAGLDYNTFIGPDTGREQFVDFDNGDYTLKLTSEVYAQMPDFEPIPFDRIGRIETYNAAPTASDLAITDSIFESGYLSGSYLYLDAEGDAESNSSYRWLVSDTADGVYLPIAGANGRALQAAENLNGRYVKFEVTPQDEAGSIGLPVVTEGYLVLTDAASLSKLIDTISSTADKARVGSALGDYPASAVADLRAALQKARDSLGQETSVESLRRAADELSDAYGGFAAARITNASYNGDEGTVTIPSGLWEIKLGLGTVRDEIVLVPEDGKLCPAELTLLLDGKEIVIKMPEGAQLSGGKLVIRALQQASGGLYGKFYSIFALGEEGDVLNASVTVRGAVGNTVVMVDSGSAQQLCILTNNETFAAKNGGEFVVGSFQGPSMDTGLSKILINGDELRGVTASKTKYIYTLPTAEVPQIEAIPSHSGATLETEMPGSVPGQVKITITAQDGKTKQVYVLDLKVKESDTPAPAPTPSSGTSGGYYGGIGAGSPAGVGVVQPQDDTAQTVGNRFTDTIGHWAWEDIEEMAARGIVSGVTADTFEPDRSITRAEFATLVAKALELESSNPAGFADVSADAWYYASVNAAANAGIITCFDGLFRPDDLITREEMAVILGKVYDFSGKNAGRGGIDRFADKDAISEWAYTYVDEAATAGLISGMTYDTFVPQENATRAQAAAVIKRLLDQLD